MKIKGDFSEVYCKIEEDIFISYNENKEKFFMVCCEWYPTITNRKVVAHFHVGSKELLSLDKYIKR